jgi:hypothetical protein
LEFQQRSGAEMKQPKLRMVFAVMAGSPSADEIIKPFLWGDRGIADRLAKELSRSGYGQGLEVIRFHLFVEGRFPMRIPDLKVGTYNSRESSIVVEIPFLTATFHELTTRDKATAIANHLRWSIETIAARLLKKLGTFDIARLLQDVERCCAWFVDCWATIDVADLTRQLLAIDIGKALLGEHDANKIENDLIEVLARGDELDGHEVAGGVTRVFVLTPSPRRTYQVIIPVLRRHGLDEEVVARCKKLGPGKLLPLAS